MSGNHPAVSVIIPAYNSSSYIQECLDSVLAQTFTDYEIILVNDGSPDTEKLERVIEPYKGYLRYIKQENRGPSGARNAGIDRARGQYVAFLDSDDNWFRDFLAEQMNVVQNDTSIDLANTDSELYGDSPLTGQTFMSAAASAQDRSADFLSIINVQCAILTSSVVARKKSLIEAGLFDESFHHSEDFDLWLRLAHRGGRFRYSKKVLLRHRLHKTSLAADTVKLLEGQRRVYQKLATLLPLTARERQAIEHQIRRCQADIDLENGKLQLKNAQFEQAAETLSRANDFYRRRKIEAVLWGLRTAPRLLRRMYLFRDDTSV